MSAFLSCKYSNCEVPPDGILVFWHFTINMIPFIHFLFYLLFSVAKSWFVHSYHQTRAMLSRRPVGLSREAVQESSRPLPSTYDRSLPTAFLQCFRTSQYQNFVVLFNSRSQSDHRRIHVLSHSHSLCLSLKFTRNEMRQLRVKTRII